MKKIQQLLQKKISVKNAILAGLLIVFLFDILTNLQGSGQAFMDGWNGNIR